MSTYLGRSEEDRAPRFRLARHVRTFGQQQTLDMREPLRQSGLVTVMAIILTSLVALLLVLVSNEAFGQMPSLGQVPYQTTARPQRPGAGRWPNFGALLESRRGTQPHPAVARIIVPEGMATAYGTGTLVDVRDGYGLVITNWHVVREATGVIEVVFPDGFRSQARALKVDPDWDLAALVIWQPAADPVPLARRAPRPGDRLTIHGYGQGEYRIATGRCTQYYAPRADYPQEMVELNVEARQGDSGGPIFNEQGELAGVLFGAGQGTTIGSFGGRVESFLATLAPDIGNSRSSKLATNVHGGALTLDGTAGVGVPGTHATSASDPFQALVGSTSPATAQSVDAFDARGSLAAATSAWHTSTGPGVAREAVERSPWQESAAPGDQDMSAEQRAGSGDITVDRASLLEQAKSLLAIIGLVAVCIQIVRVVT